MIKPIYEIENKVLCLGCEKRKKCLLVFNPVSKTDIAICNACLNSVVEARTQLKMKGQWTFDNRS